MNGHRFQFSLDTALSVSFLLGLLMYSIYLCGHWSSPITKSTTTLPWNSIATPQADFQRAINNGDLRFIGIYGVGLLIPGVPNYYPVYEKYGIRAIDGTSDCVATNEEARFQSAAAQYALIYNKLLIQWLAVNTLAPSGLPLELVRMETADPVVDVETAFANGDYHLKGYALDTLVVPLNGTDIESWSFGVDYIPGTSDAVINMRLQEKAMKYAEKYNALMYQKLKDTKIIP